MVDAQGCRVPRWAARPLAMTPLLANGAQLPWQPICSDRADRYVPKCQSQSAPPPIRRRAGRSSDSEAAGVAGPGGVASVTERRLLTASAGSSGRSGAQRPQPAIDRSSPPRSNQAAPSGGAKSSYLGRPAKAGDWLPWVSRVKSA